MKISHNFKRSNLFTSFLLWKYKGLSNMFKIGISNLLVEKFERNGLNVISIQHNFLIWTWNKNKG